MARNVAPARSVPVSGDVSGPWGYQEFLDVIVDPGHERHDELTQWYAADFNPAIVDVKPIGANSPPSPIDSRPENQHRAIRFTLPSKLSWQSCLRFRCRQSSFMAAWMA